MKIKFFMACCLMPFLNQAQTDTLQAKIGYYNSFVSGAMIGSVGSSSEKEFSVSLSTVHGIKFKPGVKLGLGVGLDTYADLKSLPLFVSLTFDKERKKQGLFIQLNSGYAWVRYTAKDMEFAVDTYERGGFMFNPMIGYRISAENFRLYCLAGYKFQVAEVGYSVTDWTGFPQLYSRHYELNRVVFQLGFGFR